MTERCEPPEHLRGRDGRHWLNSGAEDFPADWNAHFGGWWALDNHLRGHNAAEAASMGYCYLAPATTPSEVDALRAQLTRCETACFDVQRDNATLRARVAELEAVLAEYKLLFCEGYCSEIPGIHEDCSGCLARAALEEKP